MLEDNKDNNRTADAAEMTTNQYAYQNPTNENDIVVIDELGNTTTTTTTKIGSKDTDIDKLNVPEDVKSILYRTDVDEYNTKYKTSDLQTHRTGSGLDITSYSMYSGFKEPGKEPEKVIVGVAGTDGWKDWGQNFNLEINRSRYNNDSNEKLQNDLNDNFWHWHDKAEIKYELEIRQKVKALKKYRENGVPISIVGDSKGGEDAAYLALNVVKSTVNIKPGTCPTYSDADYSAVNLYLTNPKGIRVSDEDYNLLKRMADAGKITIEVVYPEIVGNLAGNRLPREIPYSRKLFTVPNALRGSISNHQIGGYETKVYQGFGGNYKFQCDEEPTVIKEKIADESGLAGLGNRTSVIVGYRYVVSHVTDKSGKAMSVNDYFFEEQVKKMARLRDEMNRRAGEYRELSLESLLECFTSEVDNKSYTLMSKHEKWMSEATPFETYYKTYKELIITQDATRYSLERDYERELESQSYSESGNYKTVVKKRVESHIKAYQDRIEAETQLLVQKAERIDTEIIPSIHEAHEKFKKSQEQIKLIIEKRN